MNYPYHPKQSFAIWANLLVTDHTFQLTIGRMHLIKWFQKKNNQKLLQISNVKCFLAT